MNLKDRMKSAETEKPTVQDSTSITETSKQLLDEQTKQIKRLMEQNESLTDTLQKSEAERQRLISETSGLKKELQHKSAEIVRLRESDESVKDSEQKLKELQQQREQLQKRESEVAKSEWSVRKKTDDLADLEKKLKEKIGYEARMEAKVLSKERVDSAEKAQKEAEERAEHAEKLCIKAWLVVIFSLGAVVVRSAPLLGDLADFFDAVGKGIYVLFALCPMAYSGASSSVSGKAASIALGIMAFALVLAIVLGICGVVIYFTGKYLVKHYRSFLGMGVLLVYAQGIIKEGYPNMNLGLLWILAYIGFQIVAFFVQDYMKARAGYFD